MMTLIVNLAIDTSDYAESILYAFSLGSVTLGINEIIHVTREKKQVKFRALHAILMARGYMIVRESKHKIYSNGHYNIAVPHSKEIAIGTIRDIFKILYPNNIQLANKQMRQELGKAA